MKSELLGQDSSKNAKNKLRLLDKERKKRKKERKGQIPPT